MARMWVSVWAWLLLLEVVWRGGVALTCPADCQCFDRGMGQLTACIGMSHDVVPEDIPVDTEELYLKRCSIRHLRDNAFSKFKNLRTLGITSCQLEIIDPNAFVGLANLGFLDLQDNSIREIQPHTFSGLFHLTTLIMDINSLKTIHNFAFHGLNLTRLRLENNPDLMDIYPKAFHTARVSDMVILNSSLTSSSLTSIRPLSDSLKELSIQHNSQPLVIPDDLFKDFTFRSLDLSYNGIKDASFLIHVDTDELSLHGNPVGPIDFSQYPHFTKVQKLKLDDTGFNQIKGRYFSRMSNLAKLQISRNGIQTLPESLRDVFTSLTQLKLEGNPLHCNCKMKWFKRWLASTTNSVLGATCAIPIVEDVIFVPDDVMKCKTPTIVSMTTHQNISESSELRLTCVATADPAPALEMTLPSGVVVESSDQRVNATHTTAVFTIARAGLTDAGQYRCNAKNVKGNISAVSHVDVYSAPYTGFSHGGTCTSYTPVTLGFVISTLVCLLNAVV